MVLGIIFLVGKAVLWGEVWGPGVSPYSAGFPQTVEMWPHIAPLKDSRPILLTVGMQALQFFPPKNKQLGLRWPQWAHSRVVQRDTEVGRLEELAGSKLLKVLKIPTLKPQPGSPKH